MPPKPLTDPKVKKRTAGIYWCSSYSFSLAVFAVPGIQNWHPLTCLNLNRTVPLKTRDSFDP